MQKSTMSQSRSWEQSVRAWRIESKAAGLSPRTIHLRTYYLTRWQRICKHPAETSRGELLAFIATDGWAPETRRSVRSALVSFYGWYYRDDPMSDPARTLPTVKVPIGLPRPAPDDCIRTALAGATPDVWLMILLGAVNGMRRGEITMVRREDLDGQHLRIMGKGGRERVVWTPEIVASTIRSRPPGYLFTDHYHRSRTGRPMTAGHIGKLISRMLPEGTTPHQLRHAAATELHEQGCSMEEIRKFLGHASISTTQRYVLTYDHRTAAATARAAQRFAA